MKTFELVRACNNDGSVYLIVLGLPSGILVYFYDWKYFLTDYDGKDKPHRGQAQIEPLTEAEKKWMQEP